MASLNDKIILMVGVGGLIGNSLINIFSKEHSGMALASRDSEKLRANEKNSSESGGKVIIIDIKPEFAMNNIIEQTVKEFGRIDLIINNTGIFDGASLELLNGENFDTTINTLLKEPLLLVQSALPEMKKQNTGTIINIVSNADKNGFQALFEAAKKGLVSMSKFHPEDIKRSNIKIHTLSVYNLSSSVDKLNKVIPDDIAKVVYYLATLPQRVHIDELTIGAYNDNE